MLARLTWREMRHGHLTRLYLGEESITDYRLLQLKYLCPSLIDIRKHTKQREEPLTGADWEWWIGDYVNGWFGFRVQAKRMNNQLTSYGTLLLNQCQTLIFATPNYMFPLYCFYNSAPYNPHVRPPLLRGCTVADATRVRTTFNPPAGTQYAAIYGISRPWHEFVCRDAGSSLAIRCRNAATDLRGNGDGVPEPLTTLPSHVTNQNVPLPIGVQGVMLINGIPG